MMTIPIPLYVLPHTVTLKHAEQADKWGSKAYNETALLRVRIEPKTTLVYTKDNQTLTLNAKLFIDAVNSVGAGADICEDDIIVFGGREYTVKTIETHYSFGNSPHHWEVGLV